MARYKVTLCTQDGCHHPGGLHIGGGVTPAQGCQLCNCPGWDESKTLPGWWSTEQEKAERGRVRRSGE